MVKREWWGRVATFLKVVKEGIWEEETSAEAKQRDSMEAATPGPGVGGGHPHVHPMHSFRVYIPISLKHIRLFRRTLCYWPTFFFFF